MKTGLLHDPIFAQHDPGLGHPECPARWQAIDGALRRSGLLEKLVPIVPRPAADAELELVHHRDYIRLVEREMAAGARQLSTGDTAVGARSLEVARMATGGVLAAAEAIMLGKCRNAFCATRPPGHHATADRGMGFCIFNHVAIAARFLQSKHQLERVAIVDWDVHHGNGTQDIFYEDGSVFYISTHQSPLYPGTGAAEEIGSGAGRGMTRNFPFRAGAGMKEIGGAFEDSIVPLLDSFRPECVIISAGFDSRRDDPLGGFHLSDEDFAVLTGLLMEVARRHSGDRVLSVLEGGYNAPGLARAVVAHVEALSREVSPTTPRCST